MTKSRSSSSSMFPPANGTGDNCVTSGTCRAIQLASKREKSRYLLARCLSTDVLDSPGDCDVDCLFRAASVQGSPSSMDPFFFLKPLAFVRFYTRASFGAHLDGHRGLLTRRMIGTGAGDAIDESGLITLLVILSSKTECDTTVKCLIICARGPACSFLPLKVPGAIEVNFRQQPSRYYDH